MEVNEYIRYNGKINKVTEIKQVEDRTIIYLDNELAYNSDDLKEAKHSEDITDLIREDDYVNGYKVSYSNGFYQYWDNMFDKNTIETDKDIKSIVTKEQFNSIKYILEE